jgi:hypothetical protein
MKLNLLIVGLCGLVLTQSVFSQDKAVAQSPFDKTVRVAPYLEPAIPRAAQQEMARNKLAALKAKTGRAPNILIIVVDDMGWGDIGVNGGGVSIGAPTPNIDKDFSQANDLAAVNPKKLEELKVLFDAEARKYNVYPLDDRGIARSKPEDRQLSQTAPRPVVTYLPGAVRISEYNMPDTKNKSFSVDADVIVAKGGANGVIAAVGGVTAGWSLYFQDNRPAFVYNYFNSEVSTILTFPTIFLRGKSGVDIAA